MIFTGAALGASLPSRDVQGAQPHEHSSGVGALPGTMGEAGVAVLPDEKHSGVNSEGKWSHDTESRRSTVLQAPAQTSDKKISEDQTLADKAKSTVMATASVSAVEGAGSSAASQKPKDDHAKVDTAKEQVKDASPPDSKTREKKQDHHSRPNAVSVLHYFNRSILFEHSAWG